MAEIQIYNKEQGKDFGFQLLAGGSSEAVQIAVKHDPICGQIAEQLGTTRMFFDQFLEFVQTTTSGQLFQGMQKQALEQHEKAFRNSLDYAKALQRIATLPMNLAALVETLSDEKELRDADEDDPLSQEDILQHFPVNQLGQALQVLAKSSKDDVEQATKIMQEAAANQSKGTEYQADIEEYKEFQATLQKSDQEMTALLEEKAVIEGKLVTESKELELLEKLHEGVSGDHEAYAKRLGTAMDNAQKKVNAGAEIDAEISRGWFSSSRKESRNWETYERAQRDLEKSQESLKRAQANVKDEITKIQREQAEHAGEQERLSKQLDSVKKKISTCKSKIDDNEQRAKKIMQKLDLLAEQAGTSNTSVVLRGLQAGLKFAVAAQARSASQELGAQMICDFANLLAQKLKLVLTRQKLSKQLKAAKMIQEHLHGDENWLVVRWLACSGCSFQPLPGPSAVKQLKDA